MNVAYAFNRYYLRYALVSIYSLLTAGRGGRPVHILLMAGSDVEKNDLDPVFHLVSRFPACTAEARWPGKETGRVFAYDEICFLDRESVQIACYRLLIPDLLKDEPRCLYLDCDTVVRRPLTELYDYAIENASIAGVTDRVCLEEDQVQILEEEYGIHPGFYINSGVILMNLSRMRASGDARRTVELAAQIPFRYVDQDALNRSYQNKIRLLPKKYNVFPDDDYPDMRALRALLPQQAGLFPDEALDDPVIVHYIGNQKPWSCSDLRLAGYWREAENACAAFLESR